jgi:hypothetical protein
LTVLLSSDVNVAILYSTFKNAEEALWLHSRVQVRDENRHPVLAPPRRAYSRSRVIAVGHVRKRSKLLDPDAQSCHT